MLSTADIKITREKNFAISFFFFSPDFSLAFTAFYCRRYVWPFVVVVIVVVVVGIFVVGIVVATKFGIDLSVF